MCDRRAIALGGAGNQRKMMIEQHAVS